MEETDIQNKHRISLLEEEKTELKTEVQSLGVQLNDTKDDLNEAREEIRKNANALVEKTTHTNSIGEDMANQTENQERLQVKNNYLKEKGERSMFHKQK